MGAEIILSEPRAEQFDTLDKLCEEYDLKLAIHDHPKPTRYWNPDFVLKVCRDRSHRIGACCDTGHWLRSGLNPVECIKKLEGRIIYFHFKDLNKAGNHADTHDVPWGTGVCDVPGMLAEVHRQGVKAPFFVEYGYHWETSMPEIAQSIKFSTRLRPNWRQSKRQRISCAISRHVLTAGAGLLDAIERQCEHRVFFVVIRL